MTDDTATLARFEQAKQPHRGVFLVGPDQLELRSDEIPAEMLSGTHVITQSLGYCRCTSDNKAIRQYTRHARVPNSIIALGHETVHRIVWAPPDCGVRAGDLVAITTGHAVEPVDPLTFKPDPEHGVLASLGYSYRYIGALREYNAIPVSAMQHVPAQGFGELFSRIPPNSEVSLASLAHAEPYACCRGSSQFMCFRNDDGTFSYDVPAGATIAFLGGTSRMAVITLTIIARRPADTLPQTVYITGSTAKLEALSSLALVRSLRDRGVRVELIDRHDPDIVSKLTQHGKPRAVWTNFAAQDVYDQAVQIIADGGNINNYAGASDPDIVFRMDIPAVPPFDSPAAEAAAQMAAMHHNATVNSYERVPGVQAGGVAAFLGFAGQAPRLGAYLAALPPGHKLTIDDTDLRAASRQDPAHSALEFVDDTPRLDDVFIAGTGDAAAAAYTAIETRLQRNAAVNVVDGGTTLHIRSRTTHYASRHQVCGPTVPFSMTNTSEPYAWYIAEQGQDPVDFDWLIKGVAGLDHAIEMIRDVEAKKPLGSYFCPVELAALPYVEVDAAAFRAAADATDDARTAEALRAAATELDHNGNAWSRDVERALYAAYGVAYPLDAASR